jgi:hypothetical protein
MGSAVCPAPPDPPVENNAVDHRVTVQVADDPFHDMYRSIVVIDHQPDGFYDTGVVEDLTKDPVKDRDVLVWEDPGDGFPDKQVRCISQGFCY